MAAAERELSFAALGDLLAGTQDEIGRLPAPQRRALRIALVLEEPQGEPPDERAIAVATLALLRRLAADAPLLVALDDLQWLDRASAGVLGFAFRRLDAEPVGVLATARTGSAEPLVDLETEERLLVGPLSLQALDQLVRARLGARLLRPTLRQLEQASGGNPFYALELAASLLRSGHRLEPGEPLPIRGRLRELVGERLATLTPGGRRAALAAAALAQPTETALRRAARGDADAVDDAVSASVLVRDGETVRFAHPLLASTLYDDASPAERRNLHLRLARLVRDPEERARHLAEAAEGPDETVAEALEVAAANVAARGAPDTGAQLAKRAVELTPPERSAEATARRGAAGAPTRACCGGERACGGRARTREGELRHRRQLSCARVVRNHFARARGKRGGRAPRAGARRARRPGARRHTTRFGHVRAGTRARGANRQAGASCPRARPLRCQARP